MNANSLVLENVCDLRFCAVMQLLHDIWMGFCDLPVWVRVWVAGILVPVNLASVVFIGQPWGVVVAVLAVDGMFPNLIILLKTRAFGKEMAVSHLIFWTPMLIVILAIDHSIISSGFQTYLFVLFAVDAVSLCFDIGDTRSWWRARAEGAGKK